MKLLQIKPAVLALFITMAFLSGCTRKKPVLVMPQEQPPTAAPEPTPQPAEPQQPTDSQTLSANGDQSQPAKQEPDKSKTKPARRRAAAKKSASQPAASGDKPAEVAKNIPPKQIIRDDKADPPPSSGQISPAPTLADAMHDQATTEQLLQSTEAQLNGIKRQLSKEEEAMRTQTKEFIAQSRKAATENDLVRAHNLAVKARLLSDELVKQH